MKREAFQLRKRDHLRGCRIGFAAVTAVLLDDHLVRRIGGLGQRIRIAHRRHFFPEHPIVRRACADWPARISAVHFEPDAAAAAADQRPGDMRAHVMARFAIGAALDRARRAQALLGGERPRHRARV